jgi:hypothetical protein
VPGPGKYRSRRDRRHRDGMAITTLPLGVAIDAIVLGADPQTVVQVTFNTPVTANTFPELWTFNGEIPLGVTTIDTFTLLIDLPEANYINTQAVIVPDPAVTFGPNVVPGESRLYTHEV